MGLLTSAGFALAQLFDALLAHPGRPQAAAPKQATGAEVAVAAAAAELTPAQAAEQAAGREGGGDEEGCLGASGGGGGGGGGGGSGGCDDDTLALRAAALRGCGCLMGTVDGLCTNRFLFTHPPTVSHVQAVYFLCFLACVCTKQNVSQEGAV
jgi:hypothetical protein